MANRPLITPYPVIINGNMAGDITSLVTIIPTLSILTYTYSWSGSTPVGTIKIQASNDYSLDATGQVKNSGTWIDLYMDVNGAQSSSISISGNSGTGVAEIGPTALYALRTTYTAGSGTGTLQCSISAKVT